MCWKQEALTCSRISTNQYGRNYGVLKKKNHYLSNKWFSQESSIDAKIVGRNLMRIFLQNVKVFFHKLFIKREK